MYAYVCADRKEMTKKSLDYWVASSRVRIEAKNNETLAFALALFNVYTLCTSSSESEMTITPETISSLRIAARAVVRVDEIQNGGDDAATPFEQNYRPDKENLILLLDYVFGPEIVRSKKLSDPKKLQDIIRVGNLASKFPCLLNTGALSLSTISKGWRTSLSVLVFMVGGVGNAGLHRLPVLTT